MDKYEMYMNFPNLAVDIATHALITNVNLNEDEFNECSIALKALKDYVTSVSTPCGLNAPLYKNVKRSNKKCLRKKRTD